jgi:hypothetical protein
MTMSLSYTATKSSMIKGRAGVKTEKKTNNKIKNNINDSKRASPSTTSKVASTKSTLPTPSDISLPSPSEPWSDSKLWHHELSGHSDGLRVGTPSVMWLNQLHIITSGGSHRSYDPVTKKWNDWHQFVPIRVHGGADTSIVKNRGYGDDSRLVATKDQLFLFNHDPVMYYQSAVLDQSASTKSWKWIADRPLGPYRQPRSRTCEVYIPGNHSILVSDFFLPRFVGLLSVDSFMFMTGVWWCPW